MREGWEYKKLGEVGTFQRGKGIQKTDFVERGMPCIHYGQLHTVFGVATEKHLSHISRELYSKSIIASKNDVIFALTSEDVEGSCRSTAWLGDYDVAISSDAAVYKHSINPKFVAYYLRSDSFFIEKSKYARGFKVTHIKTSDIEKIPIPLPSLEVQQKVVAELDQINDLIRLKKEQLKEYDNLAQSIFYDMFGDPVENEKGWEVKKLQDISTIVTGNTPSRKILEFYNNDFIEWIKSDNIDDSALYPTKAKEFLSENGANKGRIANLGEILVTCIAGSISSIGTSCVLNRSVAFNQQINAITKLNDVDAFFLRSLIKYSKKYFQEYATTGMKHIISKSVFESIKVPLPPLPLQQEFSSRIEQMEKLKAEVQKTITDLETLLASRMQYWFE